MSAVQQSRRAITTAHVFRQLCNFASLPGLLLSVLLPLASAGTALAGSTQTTALQIINVSAAPAEISQFQKLELTFDIIGSVATRMQWPYDPAPPNGVPAGIGINVNGVFIDPDGREFLQPAFYAEQFIDEVREGRDWHLPTGSFVWKVRFSPNRPGRWSYRVRATDRSGTVETAAQTIEVTASARRGFIRVSQNDSRYFEFDDGSLFTGLGYNWLNHLDNPSTKGASEYATMASQGANFLRIWVSSVFGSAWTTWVGGRNQYRGYLPVTGLTSYRDNSTGETSLTMKLDYETSGDTGWFDACRMQLWWWDEAESIKPGTNYRIRVEYYGSGIVGPRNANYPSFGLVAKIGGGWHANCYEPGTSVVVSSYGGNTTGLASIEGVWNSGAANFLPRMHLALENVQQGSAWVKSVSLREDLGNGGLGPEMMIKPSMDHHLYIAEEKAYSLDKVVENAERNGLYLKLVLMDKDDKIYRKMANDGTWTGDNANGFYGLGRDMNKTRWLQQMWWRYAQARWGYSPNVHSWELTNEGDPALTTHYQLADEMGKFMHCRVFGVEPGAGDGAECLLRHPNRHLVTTSFWHSFPGPAFWGSTNYPNVDYADIHAYVSTSYAPLAEREKMQWDAAYYRTWHSQNLADAGVGKPIVRGEAGLDSTTQQNQDALGLNRDVAGIWLHNYLWSGLDRGGMYEMYWWREHLSGTTFDHRGQFRAIGNFLRDIPLHKGGFVGWGGNVSNPALRAVGQKNTTLGALQIWVQNRQHTWKNVVDGIPIEPVSGELVIPGFRAGAAYRLERWDTYEAGGRIASTEQLVADSSGALRVLVASLRTDVALKISASGGLPRAPANLRIVP